MKIVFKILLVCFIISCGPRTGIHEPQQTISKEEGKKTIDPKYLTALQNGKILFKTECAVCHLSSHAICGNQSLKNLPERLPSPPEEYFIKYVRNSEKLRREGDPYATKVWEDYGRISMPAFDTVLTDVQIAEIFLFIAEPELKP